MDPSGRKSRKPAAVIKGTDTEDGSACEAGAEAESWRLTAVLSEDQSKIFVDFSPKVRPLQPHTLTPHPLALRLARVLPRSWLSLLPSLSLSLGEGERRVSEREGGDGEGRGWLREGDRGNTNTARIEMARTHSTRTCIRSCPELCELCVC